jgi:hypothetical protein
MGCRPPSRHPRGMPDAPGRRQVGPGVHTRQIQRRSMPLRAHHGQGSPASPPGTTLQGRVGQQPPGFVMIHPPLTAEIVEQGGCHRSLTGRSTWTRAEPGVTPPSSSPGTATASPALPVRAVRDPLPLHRGRPVLQPGRHRRRRDPAAAGRQHHHRLWQLHLRPDPDRILPRLVPVHPGAQGDPRGLTRPRPGEPGGAGGRLTSDKIMNEPGGVSGSTRHPIGTTRSMGGVGGPMPGRATPFDPTWRTGTSPGRLGAG